MDAALDTWPSEYRDFLQATQLATEALDDEARSAFLDAAGFVRGIRPLVQGALATLGFIEGEDRPLIARRELRGILEGAPALSGEIPHIFAGQLLALHAKKRIIPSLALYRRLAGIVGIERLSRNFLLDCIVADQTWGASEEEGAGPPEGLLASYIPVCRALADGEGRGAGEALEAFQKAIAEAGNPPFESALLATARAMDEFARGFCQAASARIRPALMSLHKLESRRAEAKAHRVLGMCSLAARQVLEGEQYLSNAMELASLVPDPLEVFFAALAAAGSAFVLGDLRGCGTWRDRAASMAEEAFRPDWALAADFLSGRLAFELGRYGVAEEHFAELAAKADRAGLDGAARRGRVWAGRSAAYAGSGGRARDFLASFPDDAESSWFLAELAAWEGDWSGAARLAEGATELVPQRGYRTIDAVTWDTGFDMIEEPSLGEGPGCPYLADQTGLFATFAEAMRSGDPERLAAITARTREQRLASIHPQAHLYDYFAFIFCESLEKPPVDPGTLLSRAWKALQVRTMRMEEASMKNSFLESNRWNREIVAAARARRLI